MKVITIRQPWATLIALGEKKFETRSWSTNYREELAIHAGKSLDRQACLDSRINKVLNKHGIIFMSDLPVGAIIAIVQLTECHC